MHFYDVAGIVGGLLLWWRIVLCLAVSSLGALLLVYFFPWFNGLQAILFATLGFLPGAIWEEVARPSPAGSTSQSTSTFVAVLAAIIFGITWGAASSTSLHSALAGLIVLLAVTWIWFQYVVSSQAWLSQKQGIFCTVIVALTYPTTALIAHHALFK
ncbi:MAG: hypothetical protein FWF20_07420 [Betaproteobacteria bacterium]|nr:hypothetical protein [Betaproteobacteria bacterium]MCL2886599.1 hypothetical protein [Betaproteobacteria bacterium]